MKKKKLRGTVNTLKQIMALPLGTCLFSPTPTEINWVYYYGPNPKSEGSIILGSAGNVNTIHGEYIGKEKLKHPYYLDYQEACYECLKMAKANIKIVEDIFINSKI